MSNDDKIIKNSTGNETVDFYNKLISFMTFDLLNPPGKENLQLLYIKNQSPRKKLEHKITLIYSEGETLILENKLPFLIDLSIQLKCDVVAYNIYNNSLTKNNEIENNSKVLNSNELVLNFKIVNDYLIQDKNIKLNEKDIILFLNGAGTYPLCKNSNGLNFKGIILVNPFHFNFNEYKNHKLMINDFLCNVHKIKYPTFLMIDSDSLENNNDYYETLYNIFYKENNKMIWLIDWRNFEMNCDIAEKMFNNNIELLDITCSTMRNKFYDKIKNFIEEINIKENKKICNIKNKDKDIKENESSTTNNNILEDELSIKDQINKLNFKKIICADKWLVYGNTNNDEIYDDLLINNINY